MSGAAWTSQVRLSTIRIVVLCQIVAGQGEPAVPVSAGWMLRWHGQLEHRWLVGDLWLADDAAGQLGFALRRAYLQNGAFYTYRQRLGLQGMGQTIGLAGWPVRRRPAQRIGILRPEHTAVGGFGLQTEMQVLSSKRLCCLPR